MSIKVLVPHGYLLNQPEYSFWRNFYEHATKNIDTGVYGIAEHPEIMNTLRKELIRYQGTVKITKNRVNFLLRFVTEQDYLLFKLKWT